MRVGFHVSIRGSIDQAIDRATAMGINTFQIFTRNPRRWKFSSLDLAKATLFKKKLCKVDIEPIFVHMPYLPNLASPRITVYNLSVQSLTAELNRCHELGISFLVTHLGSHLGSGKAMGLKRVSEAINTAFSELKGNTVLLIENAAGSKNNVGAVFEDLKRLIDKITCNEQVGVCLDTCHAFAAGYDLRTKKAVEDVIATFDSILGLNRLKLVHLNDSVGCLGSYLDRHEHLGLGRIGEKGFTAILNSEFGTRPLIMETPVDARRSDLENLLKVKELAKT
jgi:deoxyribonuclease-4